MIPIAAPPMTPRTTPTAKLSTSSLYLSSVFSVGIDDGEGVGEGVGGLNAENDASHDEVSTYESSAQTNRGAELVPQ